MRLPDVDQPLQADRGQTDETLEVSNGADDGPAHVPFYRQRKVNVLGAELSARRGQEQGR
eukprot:2493203-Pyramimonas_sp.AAC.1